MREYKLIAHRGSHKFAKENSLFSFFNAINENNMTIFDKAYFGLIPDIHNH